MPENRESNTDNHDLSISGTTPTNTAVPSYLPPTQLHNWTASFLAPLPLAGYCMIVLLFPGPNDAFGRDLPNSFPKFVKGYWICETWPNQKSCRWVVRQ